MQDNFTLDIITLVDDEGIEREFEILDCIENDKGKFYALLPNFELPDDIPNKEDTYFIFQVVEENGEKQLSEVEDDDVLDELSEIFESRFEENYEHQED